MLERVEFNLERTVSLSGAIQILHGLLQVGYLLPEAIVLTRFKLKLVLDLTQPVVSHIELSLKVLLLTILLLYDLFEAVYFHLTDVDLVLVLRILDLGGLMQFLLAGSDTVELHAHILNLLGLRVVDVGLPSDVAVALFNLSLGGLIFLGYVALSLLGLGKLDLDIAKGVFELLIFNFA